MELVQSSIYKQLLIPSLLKINRANFDAMIKKINHTRIDFIEILKSLKNSFPNWKLNYDALAGVVDMIYHHINNHSSYTVIKIDVNTRIVDININIYPVNGYFYDIMQSNGVFEKLNTRDLDELLKISDKINRSIEESEDEYERHVRSVFCLN